MCDETATARVLCTSMLERLATPNNDVPLSGNSVRLLEHYLYDQLHLLTRQSRASCPLTYAFRHAQREVYPGKQPGYVYGELQSALCSLSNTHKARDFFATVLRELNANM